MLPSILAVISDGHMCLMPDSDNASLLMVVCDSDYDRSWYDQGCVRSSCVLDLDRDLIMVGSPYNTDYMYIVWVGSPYNIDHMCTVWVIGRVTLIIPGSLYNIVYH